MFKHLSGAWLFKGKFVQAREFILLKQILKVTLDILGFETNVT